VNLVGSMQQVSVAQSIDEIKQELLAKEKVKLVVLNFAQVTAITSELVPALTSLQKSVRSKPSELRMCGFQVSLKEKISKFGILRANEMAEDLKQAISSAVITKRTAA
jgi:anti-anti-sigma regulatory factor